LAADARRLIVVVLNQNPRSAHALRLLAASLATQGRLDQAAEALREA
jgi:cytochrome c-type biogenesis protein CcmH/NrfG